MVISWLQLFFKKSNSSYIFLYLNFNYINYLRCMVVIKIYILEWIGGSKETIDVYKKKK